MKTHMDWQESGGFLARGVTGYSVKIDDSETLGNADRGARPMELLLHGLGACIGIHMLSLLKKMRVKLSSFKMEIEGRKGEDVPKGFTDIHIKYILKGKALTKSKVERAMHFSHQDCSARASLNAKISYSYEFEDPSS